MRVGESFWNTLLKYLGIRFLDYMETYQPEDISLTLLKGGGKPYGRFISEVFICGLTRKDIHDDTLGIFNTFFRVGRYYLQIYTPT